MIQYQPAPFRLRNYSGLLAFGVAVASATGVVFGLLYFAFSL